MFNVPTMRAQLVADGHTAVRNGVKTNVVGNLIIGTNGPFTLLVLTNGAVVTNTATVMISANSSARNNRVVVTSVGSSLGYSTSEGEVHVGENGSFNRLDVLEGATITTREGSIGFAASSKSNLAVIASSGSSWVQSLLQIGASGAANRLVISNGGTVRATSGTIGEASTASNNLVIVTGSGSLWSNSAAIYVGNSGRRNSLLVTNGATVTGGQDHIGFSTNSGNNAVTITGLGSIWRDTSLYIGDRSSFNQLLVTKGGKVIAKNSYVGNAVSGSNNLVVVSDTVNSLGAPPSPSLWTNTGDLYVGYSGACNQLFITNGGVIVNLNGRVGFNYYSGSNQVLVSGPGSLWQNRGSLYLGFSGKGNQLVVSNGGTVTASMLLLGIGATSASNQLVIADGNLIVTNNLNIYYGTLTLNSGLLRAATLSLAASRQPKVAFNGGTLQTRSTSATTTPFTIGNGANAAVFEMLPKGSHSFPGGLIVRNKATLKGAGRISGSVTNQNGGTLSPGSSIGQISVSGNLTLDPGSITVMELNAETGTSDTIVGMKTLTYGGTLQLSNLGGSLADGTSFRLFRARHYAGGFDNVVPHTPGPGLEWNLSRLAVDGVLQVESCCSPADGGPNTLTNGLVAYYRMDTVPPRDAVGKNDLTDEHPGKLGDQIGLIYHCITAGGNSSGFRLSHADNSTFRFGPNHDFTVSTWVNANGIGWTGNYPVFMDKGCFNHRNGFLLYHDNTTFRFSVGNGTTLTSVGSSLTAPNVSTWYNVVGRYSAANQRIYLNVQGTNYQDSTIYSDIIANNSDPFSLFAPSTGEGDCWSQLMDDVGVWDRCLSDAEVQSLYTYGVAYGKGYSWATATNTTIVFQGDARLLGEPTLQTMFSGMSWASNHMTVPQTIISMYVLTNAQNGDPYFGALETNLAQVLSYKGPGTNLYWVGEVGVNDIIVKNSFVTNLTAVQIATALTNFMTALVSNGVKVVPITIYDVQGFEPIEEEDRRYLNHALTHVPGILGFLNTDPWLDTNAMAGFYNASESELTDAGNTNVATHLNKLLNAIAPRE
jgi:T5SS/PEP-CTERM-associated repeat protein